MLFRSVVSGYKKVEDGFVGGYKKIEDRFVKAFLTSDEEVTSQDGQPDETQASENEGD